MVIDTWQYITAGIILGFTAGISPGPLLTLLLTQTIKHNRTEGIKVAVSPLITDLPIILIAWYVFNHLTEFDTVLAIISFTGSMYIAWLGYESFTTTRIEIKQEATHAGSLKKGILANFLNPHPYLFWATIGMPYVVKARETSPISVILFFGFFYLLLVGSKIILAVLAGRSKLLITDRHYAIIMKFLGVLLFLFAFLFLYDGLKFIRS